MRSAGCGRGRGECGGGCTATCAHDVPWVQSDVGARLLARALLVSQTTQLPIEESTEGSLQTHRIDLSGRIRRERWGIRGTLRAKGGAAQRCGGRAMRALRVKGKGNQNRNRIIVNGVGSPSYGARGRMRTRAGARDGVARHGAAWRCTAGIIVAVPSSCDKSSPREAAVCRPHPTYTNSVCSLRQNPGSRVHNVPRATSLFERVTCRVEMTDLKNSLK